MFVEFDIGIENFIQTNIATFDRDRRRYYVHKKLLFLMVLRNNLTLSNVCQKVTDANIGWDNGTPGYVSNENIDKRHSKMTVYSISKVKPEAKLTDILKNVTVG